MEVLIWLVELDRIDIAFLATALASYVVMLRIGHLVQVLHIVKYIKIYSENELTFGPQPYFIIPQDRIEAKEKQEAMISLYIDVKEDLSPNAPLSKGDPVKINCFVDLDHTAGDQITRRSHIEIILYLNKSLIS